jgi:uncharacterized SAM-binding protein YcdF (DUF218 family)
MLVLAVLVLGVWFEREPLLRGVADLWIVSDPVTRADAVVVLGGGLDVRPFAAADFYRRGLVNKILISQVEEERPASIGAVPGHTELNRAVLLKLGVPDAAIKIFGRASKNTWEEALALRDWAARNDASAVIIPTEIFSARRVSWIFRHEIAGKPLRIEVLALDSPRYTRSEWWKTEQGLIAFQNEFLKYIYYRLKY